MVTNILKANSSSVAPPSIALARFAKLVVAATLTLIFIGGLVTSWAAGMAVPDWPLSFNSINPTGWWADFQVRLEHGHRLFAMLVGVLTGILCCWIWGNWRALVVAILIAAVLPSIAALLDVSKSVVMHLRIWPAAIGFVVVLFAGRHVPERGVEGRVRWLGMVAFFLVCLQATLGGLRVTRETAGAVDVALVLRIVHGCVAQGFLCVLVAIATLLARGHGSWPGRASLSSLEPWAWGAAVAVYIQLILGATMRHLGAGLAIPTFPAVSPDGRWLPSVHNAYIDLNFAHTRLGAVLVSLILLILVAVVLRRAQGVSALTRPAALLGVLIVIQFILGMFVIWHLKPRTLTTFHVVNGALVLATTVWLAIRVRLCRASLPDSRAGAVANSAEALP